MTSVHIMPTEDDLEKLFRIKYGDVAATGWGPQTRHRYRYYTPDDVYEATVDRLVTPDTSWLDVGAGRNLFPSNKTLSRTLAERCKLLVGVDPDDTILENRFVHDSVQVSIETADLGKTFDLITLRMVAEHVDDPDACFDALRRHTHSGSTVALYTVNKWSPVPMFARVVPSSLQNPLKNIFWRTEDKDTFPVRYRMNTRRALQRLAEAHGFKGVAFEYLDDCRVSSRFRALQVLELSLWRLLRIGGIRYPENCLLAIYERA